MEQYTETKQRRIEVAKAYQEPMSRGLLRMFLEYDRYSEACKIIEALKKDNADIESMWVVDYGCGPGDYGFALGRAGAAGVYFFDTDTTIPRFIEHRAQLEEHPFKWNASAIDAPTACQLAIFGEVLEHLDDPVTVLKRFVDAGTDYIFTSSYPYRTDDPRNEYWAKPDHSAIARLQQPECRALLEAHYDKLANFGGQANLWKRKIAG